MKYFCPSFLKVHMSIILFNVTPSNNVIRGRMLWYKFAGPRSRLSRVKTYGDEWYRVTFSIKTNVILLLSIVLSNLEK